MAVSPRWPPSPGSLAVDHPTYELKQVPLTSVAFVSSRIVKASLLRFRYLEDELTLIGGCSRDRGEASNFSHERRHQLARGARNRMDRSWGYTRGGLVAHAFARLPGDAPSSQYSHPARVYDSMHSLRGLRKPRTSSPLTSVILASLTFRLPSTLFFTRRRYCVSISQVSRWPSQIKTSSSYRTTSSGLRSCRTLSSSTRVLRFFSKDESHARSAFWRVF
jgi:curved DNA-binding protein CbpA